MQDEKHNLWDVIMRLITALISLLVVLVGIWQFSEQQRQTTQLEYSLIAKKDSIDFKKKIWEMQVEVYTKICSNAAEIIVSVDDKEKFNRLLMDYDILYYGETIFVEDSLVDKSMINFRLACKDYSQGYIDKWTLKQECMNLISACRLSTEGIFAEIN